MVEGVTLDEAKQTVAEAKRKSVEDCGEELRALLEKYKCSLASYQELMNGIPKGPAQIVIVSND